MGHISFPVYGEDIGSALQEVEKILNHIKTNKFDNQDIIDLFDANNTLLKYLLKNEIKDNN